MEESFQMSLHQDQQEGWKLTEMAGGYNFALPNPPTLGCVAPLK
jgi:hypothetical protein